MNKAQIRFAMAAHAAWLAMKNPTLSRIYPRPTTRDGKLLTLYGYIFYIMYEAA